MNRLNRIAAAIILASTLMLAACFGKDEAEAELPPEEIDTVTPDANAEKLRQAKARANKEAKQRRLAEAKRKHAQAQHHIAIEERRIAKEERLAEEERQQRTASKPTATPSRSNAYVGKAQAFQATAYTSYCTGCTGVTKTGVNLRKSIYHEGKRVIAVDPRYIPLGSIVRVTLANGSSFEAIAEDIGGAIKGAIIDVAHETKADANRFGRQAVEVRMIRRGR